MPSLLARSPLVSSRTARRPRSALALVLILTVAAATILTGCASSNPTPWKDGDAYVLRLRVDEGEAYEMTIGNEQSILMTVRGQEMEMSQKQFFEYDYSVADVAESGDVTVEQVLTRVRGSINVPMAGQNQSYDTADTTATTPIGEQMKALLDVPITIRMSPRGDTKEIVGFEAFIDSMAAGKARQEPISVDSARAYYGRMFSSPDEIANNSAFAFYPEEPVTIGDSWTATQQMKVGFPMRIESTYTLKSVEGRMATLGVSSTVSSPEDNPPINMGAFQMKMQMDGTMDGTLTVDLATGMPRKQELAMDLNADAEARGQGQTMDMTMQVTGPATIEVVPAGEETQTP